MSSKNKVFFYDRLGRKVDWEHDFRWKLHFRGRERNDMAKSSKIYERYWLNCKHGLTLDVSMTEQNKEIDEVVYSYVRKFREFNLELEKLKHLMVSDFAALLEKYVGDCDGRNRSLVRENGNLELRSFDGRYKIVLVQHDELRFDKHIGLAKKLIDEVVSEWAEGEFLEERRLIKAAFKPGYKLDKGLLVVGRILNLRRLEIKDERFDLAMEQVCESFSMIHGKQYLRVYEELADTQMSIPITLGLAGFEKDDGDK